MTMRNARQDAGFSLVELLVALAIFMVIMGSLGLLLSGAVNTVGQGYAMMNAMERARGSMSVLEADLKTAFSSPEKREFYQFYGEPNGFTYSGQLVSGGFGRVTYAAHADNGDVPMQGVSQYETLTLVLPWSAVARQFARALCPVDLYGRSGRNIDKNGDGNHDVTLPLPGFDPTPLPGVETDTATGQLVDFKAYAARIFTALSQPPFLLVPALPAAATASGIPNYDFPVEFTVRVQRGVLLRYEERGQGNMTSYSDPVMTSLFASADGTSSLVTPFGSTAASSSALAAFPEETREKLDQLQQGHYWVRMLSNYLPLNNSVDPFLPRPVFWTEDGGSSGKSWREYVVTEGILVAAELLDPTSGQPIMGLDSAMPDELGNPRPVPINVLDMMSFFHYGLEDNSVMQLFNTLWNLPSVVHPSDTSLPADRVAHPMFYYYLFGPTPMAPVPGYYTIDQGTPAVDAFAEALRVPVYGYTPGDPLKPRLPAWVAPGFWIFGDPPRSGAPPYHQWFQQKVDIPSGFLRDGTGT